MPFIGLPGLKVIARGYEIKAGLFRGGSELDQLRRCELLVREHEAKRALRSECCRLLPWEALLRRGHADALKNAGHAKEGSRRFKKEAAVQQIAFLCVLEHGRTWRNTLRVESVPLPTVVGCEEGRTSGNCGRGRACLVQLPWPDARGEAANHGEVKIFVEANSGTVLRGHGQCQFAKFQ